MTLYLVIGILTYMTGRDLKILCALGLALLFLETFLTLRESEVRFLVMRAYGKSTRTSGQPILHASGSPNAGRAQLTPCGREEAYHTIFEHGPKCKS